MTGSLGFAGLRHDALHALWALEEHTKMSRTPNRCPYAHIHRAVPMIQAPSKRAAGLDEILRFNGAIGPCICLVSLIYVTLRVEQTRGRLPGRSSFPLCEQHETYIDVCGSHTYPPCPCAHHASKATRLTTRLGVRLQLFCCCGCLLLVLAFSGLRADHSSSCMLTILHPD